MRTAALKALGILLLALAGMPSHALCVAPLCSCAASTSAVAFGSINPLLGPVDATGNVRVTCGGVAGALIPYRVDLGPGASGNAAQRRMSAGALTLEYGLYTDAGRSNVWGDGSHGATVTGSIVLDALGLSPAVHHPVHGRIFGGQTSAVPGAYTDAITVTLTFY